MSTESGVNERALSFLIPFHTCSWCHGSLMTRGLSGDIHRTVLVPSSATREEEDVINEAIVAHSVGRDVNHTLSFQAGIINLLMFTAGLPGWKGLSVFSLLRDQQGTEDYMLTYREPPRWEGHGVSCLFSLAHQWRLTWWIIIINKTKFFLRRDYVMCLIHIYWLQYVTWLREWRRVCTLSNRLWRLRYVHFVRFQVTQVSSICGTLTWCCLTVADMCHVLCWHAGRAWDWLVHAGSWGAPGIHVDSFCPGIMNLELQLHTQHMSLAKYVWGWDQIRQPIIFSFFYGM